MIAPPSTSDPPPDQVGPGAGLQTANKDVNGRQPGNRPAHRGQIPDHRHVRVIFRDEFGTRENHRGGINEDQS